MIDRRPLSRSTFFPFFMRLAFSMLLGLAFALALPASAQPLPYQTESGVFAITDARLETVSDGVLERGTLVIENGRIAAMGPNVGVPAGATLIDGEGLTVYPGMIDGGTRIGLQEIGSLAETRDYNEIGAITPQMQALTAVNPSSVLIPVARVAGVTTALSVPGGALMPGTAALVHLHGYTPEQMSAGFEGIVINFPSGVRRGAWDRREQSEIDKAYTEALETLDDTWAQAVLYTRIQEEGGQPLYQPEMAALAPAVRGEMPILLEVNAAGDIENALRWVADSARASAQVILTGAAEGWRVADQIAEADLPVVTGPVLSLPTRASDRYSRAYQNAALLAQAGVPVALRTQEAENVRNLPFNAGFAAAYGETLGFTREDALRAVTLTPAEIFGLSDRMGSLEVGKDATLFVADGDPFEPATQVQHVFIRGVHIPISNRQILLYDEFLNRDPGLSLGDRE